MAGGRDGGIEIRDGWRPGLLGRIVALHAEHYARAHGFGAAFECTVARGRGRGLGRRLLARALAFCDAHGFERTQLWTFDGLHAARHLYEANGFVLAAKWPGMQWGAPVQEQRFVRERPVP
jgi:GNAT superfamily N-acetyltransferase